MKKKIFFYTAKLYQTVFHTLKLRSLRLCGTKLSELKSAALFLIAAAALFSSPLLCMAAQSGGTEASSEADLPGWEHAVETTLEDGEYSVDVTLEGGSGRASISSPALLIIREGKAFARIEWSSSAYDYMKVEDNTYFPVNTEGNSVFEIPVCAFDQPVTVIGDTTAMSTPHEVEYTLTFSEASVVPEAGGDAPGSAFLPGVIIAAVLCAAAVLLYFLFRHRTHSRGKKNGT